MKASELDDSFLESVRIVRTVLYILCLSTIFASELSLAQYADDEACTVMADLKLPNTHSVLLTGEQLDSFDREFADLNPDLPSEFSALPDGWIYLVLAECYRGGIVLEKDREIANSLLRVSANEGNSQAAHMVASIDVFQSGDPSRQREGFKVLEAEYAESGSAYAAGKMGWAYQQGFGVDRDIDKALELYNVAAERGMTYWQYLLAHAYEKGYLGLEIDEERASYWRDYEPKVHVALYECWVAIYYADGTFPKNEEAGNQVPESLRRDGY